MSTENASTTNDPTADAVCMVIDPNKFHAKVASKLKVVMLTRNWKTSNVFSCVEVNYCTMA